VICAFALAAALAAACSGGGSRGVEDRVIEDLPDISVPPPGDAYGHAAATPKAVYLFSQIGNGERDPQVLEFSDAVLMRGWQKWDRWGLESSEYDFGYPVAAHERGITFVAGGTASVLFRDEAPEQFEEWATRDAQGSLVEHGYIVPGAHRGSLAHPGFRAHVLAFLKKQIDGGVDGVFLDEANAAYSGGNRWMWNGNEGYDDWFIAAFNAFLIAQHPDFTEADWITTYGMTRDNVIRPEEAAGDLGRNFNYRRYLQRNGWDRFPLISRNPLAPVFGFIEGNRMDPAKTSFRDRALLYYWRAMVTELREYARSRYGKEILVTSNGLFPFVDFNGFGLYEGNHDGENGSEVVWVPLSGGHLDGRHSHQDIYRRIRARSRAISGDVPLVLFLDWPCRTMNDYYALSVQEKKDFWRIFGAEAYANGLFFAFHLRTTIPGEPTATDSQILTFLKEYAAFYQANAAVYTEAEPSAVAVETNVTDVAGSVSAGAGETYLHLVNHHYDGGLVPQLAVRATFPLAAAPSQVTVRTPDPAGANVVGFEWSEGSLSVTVDRLESYDLIVVE
jgi:hypothetical protein